MIQTIRGTKDILPDTINYWQFIERCFKSVSEKYGYNEIRTPIFEKTEVFSRSIGESTDIVNKEMYSFLDRGGDSITLRPEMTASIVRSAIQNSLLQKSSTLRFWYFGPFFRYERPQKGRMRQFHQYGAECIGSPYPETDAEIILLANDIIKSTGINDFILHINSLGNDASRKKYRNELINYFNSLRSSLSEDSQNRLESNPLRILDSKSPADKHAIENAPQIIDFLDEESSSHFDAVRDLLDSQDISYEIQPALVRGLDYYSHTVFEFQSNALGAQDSFGGGGRYDGLFEQLGGKAAPATGFALGVERMLLILELNNSLPKLTNEPDIYIVAAGDSLQKHILQLAEKLRNIGLRVIFDLQRRSIKAQFREANKLAAKFTIIIGEDEIRAHIVNIKNMKTAEQTQATYDELDGFDFD